MKIRFIEESKQDDILMETENVEVLNAVFGANTQIHITKDNEVLICEHNYNVLKVLENELDIYVTITDAAIYNHKNRKNHFTDKIIKLVNEEVFTDTIKKVSMCLKKSSDLLKELRDGVNEREYSNAVNVLERTCYILENLSTMNFRQAQTSTKVMLHSTGNKDIDKISEEHSK